MYTLALLVSLSAVLLLILHRFQQSKTSTSTPNAIPTRKTRESTLKDLPRVQHLKELVERSKEHEQRGYFWLEGDLWIINPELCQNYVKQESIKKSAIPAGSFARKTVGTAFISSEEKIPPERKQIRAIAPNKKEIEATLAWHKEVLFSALSKKLQENENSVIAGDELADLFMRFALGVVWELVFGIPQKRIELPLVDGKSCLDILLQDCLSAGKYSLESPQCTDALAKLRQLAESVLKESNELSDGNSNCPLDRLKALPDLEQDQLIDNIKLFILAGAETTSSTLSVICQVLARHPELQSQDDNDNVEKLVDEIIKETLRLYPTAPFYLRTSKDELNLSHNGKVLRIPSNTNVFSFTWFMQRYHNSWQHSLEFIPSRWENKTREQYYEPFGSKQRKCFGERLAMTEMRSVVLDLLTDWNISLPNSNSKDVMDEQTFIIDWCHAVVHPAHHENLVFTSK